MEILTSKYQNDNIDSLLPSLISYPIAFLSLSSEHFMTEDEPVKVDELTQSPESEEKKRRAMPRIHMYIYGNQNQ